MKRVYLLRHGKTEKESESGEDFDRRLKPKGEREVNAAAGKLAETGVHIARIFSSSAPRAAASARIAAEVLHIDAPEELDELYDAEKEDYLRVLQGTDDRLETVMVVGHNPAIEEAAEAFRQKHMKIGTGTIMWLEIACDRWSELSFETPVIRSGLVVPE